MPSVRPLAIRKQSAWTVVSNTRNVCLIGIGGCGNSYHKAKYKVLMPSAASLFLIDGLCFCASQGSQWISLWVVRGIAGRMLLCDSMDVGPRRDLLHFHPALLGTIGSRVGLD
jgi:hypothetical protein